MARVPDLGKEEQVWIHTAVDRSMGSQVRARAIRASMCRDGAYEAPRLFAAIDAPSSPRATQMGHSIF